MSEAPVVGIIMGSRSDWETMRHAAETLEQLGVPFEKEVVSAHRAPDRLYEYASSAEARGSRQTATAPIDATADHATSSSGQLGSTRATRSPGQTPRAARPAANARTSAANSPRVRVCAWPSTGTQVRNGRLASTAAHRSTSQPTSRPMFGTRGFGVIPPATARAGP